VRSRDLCVARRVGEALRRVVRRIELGEPVERRRPLADDHRVAVDGVETGRVVEVLEGALVLLVVEDVLLVEDLERRYIHAAHVCGFGARRFLRERAGRNGHGDGDGEYSGCDGEGAVSHGLAVVTHECDASEPPP